MILQPTGQYNSALGYQSLYSNTSGWANSANGYNSLNANTTGARNTAMGVSSLSVNTTGDYNTAVGYQSLDSNISSDNNTALGYNADVTTNGLSYVTCIGYEAKAVQSHTLILGGKDANYVDVGIGTDAPNELLEVAAASGNQGRMIVSDGGDSSRNVLLFVSPKASLQIARIE